MKTAILSMQRVVNFGSVLQAYSLSEMIREISGEAPAFLDIEEDAPLQSRRTIRENAQDYADRAKMPDNLGARAKRWGMARLSRLNKRLILRFMKRTLRLDDENSGKTYDCVVIGSDEVFNHARGILRQTHGDVRQARRVITYAASCGSALAGDVLQEDLPALRASLQRIEAMSVRDRGTERYLDGLYDGEILRHMDPVLMGPLHRRKPRPVGLRRYLLVYAYGQRIHRQEEIDAIRAYAKANGLKTAAIGGSQYWCDCYIPATPLRMLDYFAHADCVVTDTFHGMVFSVLHQKRFAAIIRESNRNKMTSLLEELGLEGRQVQTPDALGGVLRQEMDYARINRLLEDERRRANAYLKEHIHG